MKLKFIFNIRTLNGLPGLVKRQPLNCMQASLKGGLKAMSGDGGIGRGPRKVEV